MHGKGTSINKNVLFQFIIIDILSNAFSLSAHFRLPHRNDAKIAKICNLWTFWLVGQLIDHLFKIQKKVFLPNAPYMEKNAMTTSKISLRF